MTQDDQHSLTELLTLQSLKNEEFLLDTSFTVEEVQFAVNRLKRNKAPGPDGLTAEHLQGGGECMIMWLTRILNYIVDCEIVPNTQKIGLVVPVYKGSTKTL